MNFGPAHIPSGLSGQFPGSGSYSQQQLTPMRTSLTNAIFSCALSQLQGDTVDAHSPSNPKRPDALFALERQFCLMNALQCSALFGNGRTAAGLPDGGRTFCGCGRHRACKRRPCDAQDHRGFRLSTVLHDHATGFREAPSGGCTGRRWRARERARSLRLRAARSQCSGVGRGR
ncbi:hypothetical protein [Xenorhabdus szentirmaii]|uniref:hypothetical protein n=1 Tax=Xenorhabdus szentirmaii TaxID=290112 RepID=UPI0014748331|nr:hypothetical protein [Xenorhabdus szentirmaii]